MATAASCDPYLGYAMDTHYIHLAGDILRSPLEVWNGRISVPSSSGLGVDVDENKVEKYGHLYQELGNCRYHESRGRELVAVDMIDTIPRSFLECSCHRS